MRLIAISLLAASAVLAVPTPASGGEIEAAPDPAVPPPVNGEIEAPPDPAVPPPVNGDIEASPDPAVPPPVNGEIEAPPDLDVPPPLDDDDNDDDEIEAPPTWEPPLIIPINVWPNGFDRSINFAKPGDILQFHFMPGYSSVVESTFENPCRPREFGFSAAPTEVFFFEYEASHVFQVTVLDYNPIWFYNGASDQCNKQAAIGVVNPPWPYDQPFYDFREAARAQENTVDPYLNANGVFVPNPRFERNWPKKPSEDENTEEAENTKDGNNESETSQAVNSEAEQAETLKTEEAKMAEAQMAEEAQKAEEARKAEEAALARQLEKGKQVAESDPGPSTLEEVNTPQEAEPGPSTSEEVNTPQEAVQPEGTRKEKVPFFTNKAPFFTKKVSFLTQKATPLFRKKKVSFATDLTGTGNS
ncbi:hypothetical protein CFIMG_008297RA00001 [Ceratocystis fimbriata CBS 114723]|uniref:Uncharacterized protein n=1 Tax=Ceratocystis fimbriata CBS 114723 TaxID=1035309 RepID=A0A2C5XKH9_9PEZI|nr:hypothetical protein CFIMG_008297RA00001 [Ceratocystis fimbriata CBS 114723]